MVRSLVFLLLSSSAFAGLYGGNTIEDLSGNTVGPVTTQSGVNYLPVSSVSDLALTGTVTVQDTGSTTSTQFNSQTIVTGTPTAGSFVQFTVSSVETAMVTISGTWTGTAQPEISTDGGTTWIPHAIHQIGSASFITAFTSNVVGSLNLAAKNWIRIRATAAVTGTMNVRITQSGNPSSIYVANAIKIVDGSSQTSSTTLSIKAASSPSSFSDTGTVVSIRPDVGGNLTQTNISCGTSSTTVLAANTATQFISIRNPTTSTNTIYLNLSGSAATTAVPSIDLPPGAEADYFAFPGSFLPTTQINCISGGTASSVVLIYK